MRFEPQSVKKCTCSWCGRECDPFLMTVYAKRFEKHLFSKIEITDYIQLCPGCNWELNELALSIKRKKK